MKKIFILSVGIVLAFGLVDTYGQIDNAWVNIPANFWGNGTKNSAIGDNNSTDALKGYNIAVGTFNTIYSSNMCAAIGLNHRIGSIGGGLTYGCMAAGCTNTILEGANASFAFGDHAEVAGKQSFSAGAYTKALRNNSFALGWNIETNGDNAFTIGSGDWWYNTGPLINTRNNSLIVGFNSTKPALCVLGGVGYATIGHVGIGLDPNDAGDFDQMNNHTLSVKGDIIAERVQVALYPNWPDYVFTNDYKLKSIYELENFIELNSHLPEMPTQEEVKCDGYDLADMDAKLLQKIEELSLYIIQLKKENDVLKKEVSAIKSAKK